MPGTLVTVRVFDARSRDPVSYAEVRLQTLDRRDDDALTLILDSGEGDAGIYRGEVPPDDYALTVFADGLQTESRRLRVEARPLEELVLLGQEGQQAYYRGNVRVPFDHDEARLGVMISEEADPAVVQAAASSLGWTVEVDEDLSKLRVFVLRQAAGGEDARRVGEDLARIRGVTFIGPMMERSGQRAVLLDDRVLVKFVPEVTREQVLTLASGMDLKVERTLRYSPQTYVFRIDRGADMLLPIAVCEKLRGLPAVLLAETLVAQTLIDHSVTPSDTLYSLQWTHELIGLPEAWQVLRDMNASGVSPGDPGDLSFGSAARVVGILDTNGVQSDAAISPVAVHPDLAGTVSDGSPKCVGFFDFNSFQANNSSIGSGHGTRCAGVAVGRASESAGAYGAAGVAGNTRFLGVRLQQPLTDELLLADAIAWACGLETGNPTAGFPSLPAAPAEIINMSFGTGSMVVSGSLNMALDAVSTYGRGGRGAILVASAGNDGVPIAAGTPITTHPAVITVAASSLATDTSEQFASYTNYGEALALCAPSHNPDSDNTVPRKTYNVYSADSTGEARAPGLFSASTTITQINANGTVQVASVLGISAGDAVLAGDLTTGDLESRKVVQVDEAGSLLTLSGVLNRASGGGSVVSGPALCTATFGSTSAAAPVVAGVAALMLSACPTLSWVELRDLLRATAVAIGARTGWIGDPTKICGYGRVDAAAAVKAARDYTGGADLVVRENMADVGAVPSPGWHPISPDVWVENGDPAVSTTLLYDQQPPHQNPIRGQQNTIFVRVKNIGTQSSSTAKARVLVAHFPGVEFVYPKDWTPADEVDTSNPLAPGSYLLGEVDVPAQVGGAHTILKLSWPVALMPPAEVTVGAVTVHWHPCLLVEVTPQDGPIDGSGSIAVRRSNNLAQRNLTIVDGVMARVGVVMGSAHLPVPELILRREGVPAGVEVALTSATPALRDRWVTLSQPGTAPPVVTPPVVTPPTGGPPPNAPGCLPGLFQLLGRLFGSRPSPPPAALPAPAPAPAPPALGGVAAGMVDGVPALLWREGAELRLPIDLAAGELHLVSISAQAAGGAMTGEIQVRQRLSTGEISGGYTVRLG